MRSEPCGQLCRSATVMGISSVLLLLASAGRSFGGAIGRYLHRRHLERSQWTREKGRGGLCCPRCGRHQRNRPRFASNAYVFAGRGAGRFTSIHGHATSSAKLATLGVATDWTLHDLRRTARSLMSRAGVRPDIAERVLGHAIKGVEGVYDRHSYRGDPRPEALANLIENILRPPGKKVVSIR